MTKPAKSLEFDLAAFEDLAWWIETDRNKALRIVKLIKEIQRDPFSGAGKAEPLKHELPGCWSRRIDREHRLVYQLKEDKTESSPAATTTEKETITGNGWMSSSNGENLKLASWSSRSQDKRESLWQIHG